MERLSHCKACQCYLGVSVNAINIPYEVQDAMQAYCQTCAREIFGLPVSAGCPTTFQYNTSGGRRVIRDTKTF